MIVTYGEDDTVGKKMLRDARICAKCGCGDATVRVTISESEGTWDLSWETSDHWMRKECIEGADE
jgi:hypothetical protein